MNESTDTPVTDVELLKAPPGQRNAKATFSGATEGEALAKLVENAGVIIPPDAREELVKITEAQAIESLLDANFGPNVTIKPLNAQRIFGQFLMTNMQIQPLLLGWWYQNIAAAQDAIRFCQLELAALREGKPGPQTGGERIEGDPGKYELLKHYNNAVLGYSVVLEKMQDMAREIGLMRPQPKEKSKNKPPDVFTQTNVVVNAPSGSVAVSREERSV